MTDRRIITADGIDGDGRTVTVAYAHDALDTRATGTTAIAVDHGGPYVQVHSAIHVAPSDAVRMLAPWQTRIDLSNGMVALIRSVPLCACNVWDYETDARIPSAPCTRDHTADVLADVLANITNYVA